MRICAATDRITLGARTLTLTPCEYLIESTLVCARVRILL